MSNETGTSRFEWEKQIELQEAEQLLKLVEHTPIHKIRHLVEVGNHLFEVDEFLDENEGLVIAEVELQNENEKFTKPSWLGDEVTGQIQYYNSYINQTPFNTW